jgi:hypothetical protein
MNFLALILLAPGLIQALPGLHNPRTSEGPKKAPQPTVRISDSLEST